jgi:hypothetical protein
MEEPLAVSPQQHRLSAAFQPSLLLLAVLVQQEEAMGRRQQQQWQAVSRGPYLPKCSNVLLNGKG